MEKLTQGNMEKDKIEKHQTIPGPITFTPFRPMMKKKKTKKITRENDRKNKASCAGRQQIHPGEHHTKELDESPDRTTLQPPLPHFETEGYIHMRKR